MVWSWICAAHEAQHATRTRAATLGRGVMARRRAHLLVDRPACAVAAVQALDLRRLSVLVPLLLARQHAARAGLELDRGIADAVDLLARHVAAVPPLHRQRRLGRLGVRLRVALLQLLLRLDLELRHRGQGERAGRCPGPGRCLQPLRLQHRLRLRLHHRRDQRQDTMRVEIDHAAAITFLGFLLDYSIAQAPQLVRNLAS